MKLLFSVMIIASVLFLSSCKETNEKPASQKEQPTQTQQAPEGNPDERGLPVATDHTAVVDEVIHTTSYTYLKVKEGAAFNWLAIPKREVEVGATISYQNPMLMSNFKSKELNRTFESVYFLGGISMLSKGSSDGDTAAKPVQPVKPTVEKTIVGGSLTKAEGVHTVVVQEVIDTTSYTYLRVKEAEVEVWLAINKRPMTVGETVSFENPMEMRDFRSKALKTTFGTIYFLSGIKKDSDTAGAADTAKPAEDKKVVAEKKISVEKVEGGPSIGELFDKRDSYGGKVIQIRGEVVKFSKSIMGRNWVHLQDGTGGAGTNDLLVTTQESATVGDVVTFQGMIVLKKDFGAGYSYEVLMEMGKTVK